MYEACVFVRLFFPTLLRTLYFTYPYKNDGKLQFLFSPLYSVLTCPNSSVVRLEELLVLVVLNLNRAGTTFAAESLASNVITHAATIIKPAMVRLE